MTNRQPSLGRVALIVVLLASVSAGLWALTQPNGVLFTLGLGWGLLVGAAVMWITDR